MVSGLGAGFTAFRAQETLHRSRLRLGFRTPHEVYHGLPVPPRPWVAPCGKLFGSYPREQPKAYRSVNRAYFKRRDRFTSVALQT